MSEKKYIDVETAIQEIANTDIIQYSVEIEEFAKQERKITLQKDTKQAIIDMLDNMPSTANVVEVRHGKWEICCDGYYPYCSLCHKEPQNRVMTDFCPNCGAKMDYHIVNLNKKDGGNNA